MASYESGTSSQQTSNFPASQAWILPLKCDNYIYVVYKAPDSCDIYLCFTDASTSIQIYSLMGILQDQLKGEENVCSLLR